MVETTAQYLERLPWQSAQWAQLIAAIEQNRLHHALLLSGPAGVGKRHFADLLTNRLLCRNPREGMPCGSCHGCHLMAAGNHSDLVRIQPEESGKAIKVDAVRGYLENAALTAQGGGWKVVVIDPADALNMAASNSLLKTLEEPVADTLLLLISEHPDRLPATILSRCQRLHFTPPVREVALAWLGDRLQHAGPEVLLDLAAGAPLRALQLDDVQQLALRQQVFREFQDLAQGKRDPVAVAAGWQKQDPGQLLDWICSWIVDLNRLKLDPEPPMLINRDLKQSLNVLAKPLKLKALQDFLKQVYEVIALQGSQLNSQMQLEALLVNWATLAGR